MREELSSRSRMILGAIVEDYIASAEPISSRLVAQRYNLEWSPATVRNVMSGLEEMGFLYSPHTSAGRVPTEKAYRLYLDNLLHVGPLGARERRRIERQCRGNESRPEALLKEAGRALSSLSNYAGVVTAPRFAAAVLEHIEFVRLSREKVLVVLVSRGGSIQNRIVEPRVALSARDLTWMSNYLNQTLSGLTISEMRERVASEMCREKALYDRLLQCALELSRDALAEDAPEKVYVEGVSNILDQPDFADFSTMKRLFRAFEQKSALIDLLDKSLQAQGVQILIGSESGHSQIEGCSLVASTYSDGRGALGAIGIIGPVRMPYSTIIPMVDFTARLVSQALEADSQQESK